jgi:CubicO group peptidase (beta-lactamase class C family)
MTLLQDALLAALAAAAAVWSLIRVRRLAAIGAAYKAKVLCTIVFGTGRAVSSPSIDEVSADSYRLMRLFRVDIDRRARTVTASLPGFASRRAIFRGHLGAALLYDGTDLEGWSASALPDGSPQAGRGTVTEKPRRAAAESAALRRVVDAAFLEPDPRRLRRTRAILVVQDGQIVAERYAPGFDEQTRFPGWSMTKSVLGALVGVLVGEGRLSLADRALMPAWQDRDPRAAITLTDLLRMRSGLAFSEVYDDVTSDVIEMLFHQPDAAAFAASRPLSAPPGSVWGYSSGTTNILSAIVRRVVGEAEYPSWPRRTLFDPVGMASALMEADASGTFVASSFMLATARDWARFGQLAAQDGVWEGRRLVPEGWLEFGTTPTPQSPGGIYGAHWWLGLKPELGGGTAVAARLPRGTFFAVGHEAQALTIIPSRRLVVVRLGLSIYVDAWNHASFLAELLDAL